MIIYFDVCLKVRKKVFKIILQLNIYHQNTLYNITI